MVNALAHTVTVVGASWSRSQEWLSCSRVLWNWLHSPRSNASPQGDDGVAQPKCTALQVNRLRSNLEQPVRVGGCFRLHMA